MWPFLSPNLFHLDPMNLSAFPVTEFRRLAQRFVQIVAILLFAPLAWSHPLGDFSINQYFILDGSGPTVQIHYLLDVAEIPSFNELDLLDTNFDSEISQTEVDVYLAQRITQLVEHLHLRADGEELELTVLRHKLVLLQGNAGMVVFNIRIDLDVQDLSWPPATPLTLELSSENYPQEQGTRECLLLPGAQLTDATPAPIDSQERMVLEGLPTVYANTQASFSISLNPGANTGASEVPDTFSDFAWTSTARLAREQGEVSGAEGAAQAMIGPDVANENASGPGKPLLSISKDLSEENFGTGVREAPDTATNRLMNRISAIIRDPALPMPIFIVGLFIAMVLGMGHALSPGHGKTVMAAYLIGEKGTVWHACILGVVVTITHTWSVIFLGLVTLYFEGILSEEQVNFWTGILSGLIIVAIGIVLFRRRYHYFLATAQGRPGDWRFFHGHEHGPEDTAVTVIEEGKTPSYRNILWLGVSGGVVPCPAALIVLLLALKVGRLAYGVGLLLAFSLGLAIVLVFIGILVVRASRLIRTTSLQESGWLQILPLGSAALITVLGAWVVVWTLLQFQVIHFA